MFKSNRQTAISLGLISSFFFAITFVVNRLMSLDGGSWIWSSSLRFYWMLPFFVVIVIWRGNFSQLLTELRENRSEWFLWSTIGFGCFYAPLTFAAAYGPSWLVASTWQITIVAGLILSPFINSKRQDKSPFSLLPFMFSGIILLGVFIMQLSHAQSLTTRSALFGFFPVLLAAFAYPLGNRKIMRLADGKLDVYQRILGMLLGSMPFWILLSAYEVIINNSMPSDDQYIQTLLVAICSGVIATALFFFATDKVRNNETSLAAVEATQSVEVLFALCGEVWLLSAPLPSIYAIIGIILIIAGMALHSFRGALFPNKKNV